MQHSLFSATLPLPGEASTPVQQRQANVEPTMQYDDDPRHGEPAVQQTQPQPTTPGDLSMTSKHSSESMHQNTVLQEPAAPAAERPPNPREHSWERVERHLEEIRRLAATHHGTHGRAILHNAEQALLHLLVDTPTAEALDASLRTLARQQIMLGGAMVAWSRMWQP